MKILVVEDEPGISSFLRQGLTEAGYAVDVAQDGEEGLAFASVSEYDAMVLDIMLPRMDGLTLLRKLRDQDDTTPVLMLTARDSLDDRVRGLDVGADDYLVKPFAFPELLARMRALLRRPPLQMDTLLQLGDLELDAARREVTRGGSAVELSPREFSLLEYLMRHPGQVLTRTQIAEHIWNFDYYGGSNVVDVYIGYIRRKIAGGDGSGLIQTVRGVGYRMGGK
ncbi:MAG: response regulator transcription factor [Chloroflexi bacterium]|nr:response regulator transcription factor [Chloroflexota bacterium]MDA1227050.1 response regulator transcription factor [Chloroflexota bacterium]